jgi:hypothetical protein
MTKKFSLTKNFSFLKVLSDGFRGYILQDDKIKFDVLGINTDGSLDAFCIAAIPELSIEPKRIYCFSPDLKACTRY